MTISPRPTSGPFRTHRFIPPLLTVLLGGLLTGCGQTPPPPPEPARQDGRPNVLLITVDTQRADRLGVYGGAATPAFDRLAREGMVFDHAACPMPVTRPSHFALLTSRYPREIGVFSNADVLPEDVPTLAEVFADAGYRTAAFTGVKLLAPGSGAERGFDAFKAPDVGEDRLAGEVLANAREWLEEAPAGAAPFFLWFHVYDPHMPYGPPPPFAVPAPPELPAGAFSRPDLHDVLEKTDGDLPRSLLDFALAQYAGEVAYVDQVLGELLALLEERSLLDGTVIALTADHGECFGNGVYFEHGGCLYDGAVKVPLILRYPPAVAAGQRVTAQVELLDVAPTLLELAGVAMPEGFGNAGARERSLLSPAEDAAAFAQHPAYEDTAIDRRRERRNLLRSVAGEPLRGVQLEEVLAVRTPQYKYIAGADREELYDHVADPEEHHDLAAQRPEVAEGLRERLRRWRAAHPPRQRTTTAVDEEMEKTLRALGY